MALIEPDAARPQGDDWGEVTPPPAAPPRPTIGELFSQLTEDTTAFIRAEVALYRAQAGQKALSAGLVVGLFAGALLLAQGAIIALLVGLIIAAAMSIGIWWAILLVVGVTLAIAALLVKLGLNRVKTLLERFETA